MNNYNFDIVDSDGALFMTITVSHQLFSYDLARQLLTPVLNELNDNNSKQFYFADCKEVTE